MRIRGGEPTWSDVVKELRGAAVFRRRARAVFGVPVVLMAVGGFVCDEFHVSARGTALFFAVDIAVALLILATVVLTGRPASITVRSPSVEDARPRDPGVVLQKLAALEPRPAGHDRIRGTIARLRPDIWALAVSEIPSEQYAAQLARSLQDSPGASIKFADAALSVDLCETRDSASSYLTAVARRANGSVHVPSVARRWHRKWWACVSQDGSLKLVRRLPIGAERYEPPAVPINPVLSAQGDSAGLSLFLACVGDMLGIAADERMAIAATGHVLGFSVKPIGQMEVKASAAADADACLLLIPDDQRRSFALLSEKVPVVSVGDARDAASLWLTFRATSSADPC